MSLSARLSQPIGFGEGFTFTQDFGISSTQTVTSVFGMTAKANTINEERVLKQHNTTHARSTARKRLDFNEIVLECDSEGISTDLEFALKPAIIEVDYQTPQRTIASFAVNQMTKQDRGLVRKFECDYFETSGGDTSKYEYYADAKRRRCH